MNKVFGSRWNAALGAWVAVSEHSRARGKPARRAAMTAAAVVGGVLFTMSGVQAACTETTRSTASAGSSCTTVATSYTANPTQQPDTGVVMATGAGSTLNATGVTSVQTTRAPSGITDRAHAVYAESGGTVLLGGGVTIRATAGGSRGIYATGAGSSIRATGDVTVTTGGTKWSEDRSEGVSAAAGGQVRIDGTLDVTAGTTAVGGAYYSRASSVIASGKGSTVTLQNVVTRNASDWSSGLRTNDGGTITARQVDITVSGANQTYSYGVIAEDKGSTISFEGGTITEQDLAGVNTSNTGIRAITYGQVNVTGTVNVNTNGLAARGMYSSEGGVITLNNANVTTQGPTSVGLQIGKSRVGGTGPGTIISNGVLNVATSGLDSPGLYLEGNGSLFDASSATSTTTVDAMGPAIVYGGALNVTDQDTVANAVINRATLSTRNPTGDLIHVGGRVKAGSGLTLMNSTVAAPSGGWLVNVTDVTVPDYAYTPVGPVSPSQFMLAADASTLTGSVNMVAASQLDITLRNGATWNLAGRNGALNETSTLTRLELQDAGSTLNAFAGGAGAYTLKASVSSAGTLNLQDGKAGDVLTIQGNYEGNNGLLHLDTALGGDSSATDRLVVTGDTSGSTRIRVQNAGGVGAQTLQGIKVVDVGGQSAAGSFALAAPVQQGAYEYFLYQGAGGVNPDPVANNDWYLLSQYVPPPVQPPVNPPTNPPTNPPAPPEGPVPPPAPPAPPVGAPQVLRPAVPGYVLGPQLGNEVGLAVLDTLHRREGDQRTLSATDGGTGQAWARVHGGRLRTEGQRQFGASQSLGFLQLGGDLYASHDAGDTGHSASHTRAGLALALGEGRADVHDRLRRAAGRGATSGDVSTRLIALSGYYTRYADHGGYLDVVGQVHQVRNSYRDMYGGVARQQGTGGALSVEVGRPWRLGESRWSAEPQAQLRYLSTRYSGFRDAISSIDGQTAQSLRGRVGVRLAWDRDPAARAQAAVEPFYATVDLLHDFKQPKAVRISGIAVGEQLGPRTWLDLGIGMQTSLRPGMVLYGGLQYQHGLGGDRDGRHGIGGQLGLRARW